MAIRSAIGTPYASAASLNSATIADPDERFFSWAKTVRTDPSRATAASPAPLSLRKFRRSIILGSEPSLHSGERPLRSERISPLLLGNALQFLFRVYSRLGSPLGLENREPGTHLFEGLRGESSLDQPKHFSPSSGIPTNGCRVPYPLP